MLISDNLRHWLSQYFTQPELIPASSDASTRQYFRLTDQHQTLIVMDSSQDKQALKKFIQVASLLGKHRIKVPNIYHQSLKLGYLVLEDLGNQTFLTLINQQANIQTAYQKAIDILIALQNIQSKLCLSLPSYEADLLMTEMQLFPQWYLRQYHQLTLSTAQKKALNHCFEILINHISQQPQVFVHRDYHSRNIMCPPDNRLVLIDFQDAIIGSYTYDLCSLLKDAYYQLPPESLEALLDYYYQQSPIKVTRQTYRQDFEITSIQRQLKVLGIFARLYLRDNKQQYLKYLPRVKHYLLQTLKKFPSLAPIYSLLSQVP